MILKETGRCLILQTMLGILLLAAVPQPDGTAQSSSSGDFSVSGEIDWHEYKVQLDYSNQLIAVSVLEDTATDPRAYDRYTQEAPLFPTLSNTDLAYRNDFGYSIQGLYLDDHLSESIGGRPVFVSASLLAQKAKVFDDGLYATIEIAAQQGMGKFPGKSLMLEFLASALQQSGAPEDQPVLTIMAGTVAGNPEVDLSGRYQEPVDHILNDFASNQFLSKPISFYTWNGELENIFQQDRLLQSELVGRQGIGSIIDALNSNSEVTSTYRTYLELVSKLTNPLTQPDLRDHLGAPSIRLSGIPAEDVYFLPPSDSHEGELAKKLLGNSSIPEGFNLVEELVLRIQNGEIELQPDEDSGWYDYQTWALEPLVIPDEMPEAAKVVYEKSYRRQLLEVFKGVLALTRETHVKQLEPMLLGADFPPPSLDIYPGLSSEPLPTYYLRRAESYQFIRGILEETFGSDALKSIHRITAAGQVDIDLWNELHQMENLFLGAYAKTSRELGLPFSNSIHDSEVDVSIGHLNTWCSQIHTDADLGQDLRMMVPVFYDIERRQIKVWVFLGWSVKPMTISYARPPAVRAFAPDGSSVQVQEFLDGRVINVNETFKIFFKPVTRQIVYPVMEELYVDEILDRKEFRDLCDRFETRSEIIEFLTP